MQHIPITHKRPKQMVQGATLALSFFFFNDTATTEIYTSFPTRRSSDLASPEEIEAAYHHWAAGSRRRAAEAKPEWNQETEEQMRAVHAAYEAFLHRQKAEAKAVE